MSCDDCIKGVLHEGTPKGSIQKLAGIDTYVSLPSTLYNKKVAVVFLGDVFGFYNNAKLLVDMFAENGFACYFPDYLHGDQIPAEYMNSLPSFDVAGWRVNHSNARTREGLDPLITYLRETGVEKIAATGYCFGGRFIFDLAIENIIEVAVASHPSGIIVPTDLESLIAKSKVPLLINGCEIDATWPIESQAVANKLLGEGIYLPGFKQNYYPGCRHGFGTRANVEVPAEKAGKEGAASEALEWFKKYLI